MMSRDVPHAAALPKGWTRHVRFAVLHAISLATAAWTVALSRAATSRSHRDRLQADIDRASTEIALLKEELEIKDARWSRLAPRRRPHYTAIERMRILQLEAARGWSREQAARSFLIDEQLMRSWLRRVDEQGESALVRISEPSHGRHRGNRARSVRFLTPIRDGIEWILRFAPTGRTRPLGSQGHGTGGVFDDDR